MTIPVIENSICCIGHNTGRPVLTINLSTITNDNIPFHVTMMSRKHIAVFNNTSTEESITLSSDQNLSNLLRYDMKDAFKEKVYFMCLEAIIEYSMTNRHNVDNVIALSSYSIRSKLYDFAEVIYKWIQK
jgi:hypothetical protein